MAVYVACLVEKTFFSVKGVKAIDARVVRKRLKLRFSRSMEILEVV